jgi:hypothetical protein
MTALQTHNTAEIPLIAQMLRNEQHLLGEFIKDLDLTDHDVIDAINDRVADIISQGEGQHMAQLVD